MPELPELRRLIAVLAALASLECAPGAASSSAQPPRAKPAAPPSPAVAPASARPRLFVLPELAGPALTVATKPDGSRQLVVRGMRIIDRPDGSLEHARDALPAGRALRPLELPARLGQGYVL